MAIVAHSIVVSKSGGNVTLTSGAYELVRWSPPDLDYRTLEVSGRYQAGSRLVMAVPETATLSMVIRCKGDVWTDVAAAVNDLYVALQQFEYTVTVTLASSVETFTKCQPATIRPLNGVRTSGQVAGGWADYEISIRCVPNIGVES